MDRLCCVGDRVALGSEERFRLAVEIALWISRKPVEPRRLLYGLYSESFKLFGQKYCWVMEEGVMVLCKVTWE